MQGFVFRLIPPRPTFQSDMTDAERAAMARHGAYWRERMAEGKVVAFGPVADPAGAYGLGVVLAEDMAAAEAIRDDDPAVTELGMRTEIAPMLALVTAGGVYP